jgi:hypothetical protein
MKTTLESILFEVKKVAMKTFGFAATTSETAYAIVKQVSESFINGTGELVTNVSNELLNACSDRYNLVRNEEIFPVIRKMLIDSGYEFMETYSNYNDCKFYGKYVITGVKNEMGVIEPIINRIKGLNNDKLRPQITISNGYDGKTNFNSGMGVFRLVCTNGLTVPVKGFENINFNAKGKHTENVKILVYETFQSIVTFINNFQTVVDSYGVLTERKVSNLNDRLTEVMDAAKIKKGQEEIATIALREANLLNGGVMTDWYVYNAINAYVNDEKTSKKFPEQRAEIDSKVLEYMLA